MKSKTGLLFRCLGRDPREVLDRICTAVEGRIDRFNNPSSPTSVEPSIIQDKFGLGCFLAENALLALEAQVREGLNSTPAWLKGHNPNLAFGRFCYAVCRRFKPEVVVETGVGFGVTSTFILKALDLNRAGKLLSIDLPPLADGAEEKCGALVPNDLRSRWDLRRGRTRRILPGLLLGQKIDIFIHDSLHSLWNMLFEYRTAWPGLRSGGVLISDDVFANRAFETFIQRSDIAFSAVDGKWRFGVAMKA